MAFSSRTPMRRWWAPARAGPDAAAEHFAVQVVVERERRRDGAVGPGGLTAGLDEHPSSRQVGEAGFDVLVGLVGGGCDLCRGEGPAGDGGTGEHGLLGGGEPAGGVLDEEADAVRNGVTELVERPGGDDRTGADLEPSRSEPVVEEVFHEQRHAARAFVDERHEVGVGLAADPCGDELADVVDGQGVEGDERGTLAETQADGECVHGLAGRRTVSGSVGGDDEQCCGTAIGGDGVQEVEGRVVAPMQVLECQHERGAPDPEEATASSSSRSMLSPVAPIERARTSSARSAGDDAGQLQHPARRELDETFDKGLAAHVVARLADRAEHRAGTPRRRHGARRSGRRRRHVGRQRC